MSNPRFARRAFPCFLVALLPCLLRAAEPVSLSDESKPGWGWTLGLGEEFPGAQGSLAVDTETVRNGKACLKLAGDFSKGGNYIQALAPVAGFDVEELSLWIKAPDRDTLTLRVGDDGGRCHQFSLKLRSSPDWQQIAFPLAQFFTNHNVHESVAKYEAWGGKEGGSTIATYIAVLAGPDGQKRAELWFSEPKLYPRSARAATSTTSAVQVMRLDDFSDGEVDWSLNLGQEFPGAQGSLSAEKDQPAVGQSALKLAADFSKGGAYIDAGKDLPQDIQELQAIRCRIMTREATGFGIRLIDSSDQCHQARGPALKPDGNWQDVEILPGKVVGGEHWGGANDGQWHGPAKSVHILIGKDPGKLKQTLLIGDIRLEALVATAVRAASFAQDFESGDALAGWNSSGEVAIDNAVAFKGAHSLLLKRGQEHAEVATVATGPAFAVSPGALLVSGACAAELRSPDFSYNGQVLVEWLGGGGQVLETSEVALGYGQQAWQPFSKQVAVPAGATQARLRIQLNKTDGVFRADDLAAAKVAATERKSDRIDRITYTSAQLGNLILPKDKRVFTATVHVLKPLPPEQRGMTWYLRDYWGAELTRPASVQLAKGERSGNRGTWKADIDLAGIPLDIGRYYELVTSIAQPGAEPFVDNTSFAILSEAETKKHKREDVPFTSRNWDNRLSEYFHFSERLGIRVCGLWGDARIDLCEELGLHSLSGVGTNAIENHNGDWQKITPDVLRQQVRDLIAKCGKRGLRYISLGNEPPPNEERARECVPAYKAVYEEVKKIDPTIQVIGTSVGPVEAYFKAGFGPYQDVYDFHDYTDHHAVRAAFTAYKVLFAKYGNAKPIVSTEIGLNSQGLPRLAISNILVKSLTTFFACGGLHVSWFDMMYPDPEGKSVGTNGDSMNVFNCRYASYSPRLDAVAYYHMVNGICVKKCAGEKTYDPDIQATLFKDTDGGRLLVLWKEKGRRDVFVPLPGTGAVRVVRMDGGSVDLDAGKEGLTLEVDENPLLLQWKSGAGSLPDALGEPAAMLAAIPEGVVKGGSADLTFALAGISADAMTLTVPPGWSARKGADGKSDGKPTTTWTVTAPDDTAAREGRVAVSLGKAGELWFGLPVTGRMSVRLLPTVALADGKAGLRMLVRNNGREKQTVDARFTLVGEFAMAKGTFVVTQPAATKTFFAAVADAKIEVDSGAEKEFAVPLAGVDPQTLYRVQATVTDAMGRAVTRERLVAGFAGVPRAKAAIAVDGNLKEADWQRSPVLQIAEARQFSGFGETRVWRGAKDLGAELRLLWDDQNLYLAVQVADDVFRNEKQDGDIWAGDGIQFLVDPCRESPEKIGKYDYGAAQGSKGTQVWCFGSADAGAPAGEVAAIKLAIKPSGTAGARLYELAIPWSRLAPFQPGMGRDLGLSLILNDDDGQGRDSFMGWFSGVHSKEVDMVGDVILGE